MLATLAGAFTAGLVGSPHCIGMCGGFAAATATDPVGAVAWHLGRLSTYATLGAAAAAFGAHLPGPGWVPAVVAAALLVWFSAHLAGLVPQWHLPVPGLARAAAAVIGRDHPVARFVFGMLTGLLPCGLVWAALGVPMASGHIGVGALAMVVFGLGTTPLLAGAAGGVRALAVRSPAARRALAAAVLVAGLWSIAARQAAAPTSAHDAPTCHEE